MSREIPARVLAFDAALAVAAEKAEESGTWSRRFTTADVAERVEEDVSERTVRRALKDAEQLERVERASHQKKWTPGERAQK